MGKNQESLPPQIKHGNHTLMSSKQYELVSIMKDILLYICKAFGIFSSHPYSIRLRRFKARIFSRKMISLRK